MTEGVVIREKKGLYSVAADGRTVPCHAGSRIRKGGFRLLAGDRVEIELNSDGSGFITALLPRVNSLARPLVANIDLFVIVAAAASPAPYPYNIDKLTAMAAKRGIETAIAVNKCDVGDPEPLCAVYGLAGYRCFRVCAATGEGVGELAAYLKGKTAVFAGASGVGKSSLLNALFSGCDLQTGELSRRTERGKNTTRHTEFFAVGDGTYIADTPGFTSFDEENLGIDGKGELFSCFPEFEPFFGKCRWRGCTHTKEEGCAITEAVRGGKIAASRHESYVRLYGALAEISRRR